MALTLQSGVDLARIDTNDADTDALRTSDADMQKHANAALLILFNRAPHLWHGQYGSIPSGELALAAAFPIHAQWMRPFADLIVALAESKDDEFVVSQRVEAIMNRALAFTVT